MQMATLSSASDLSKEKISVQDIIDLASSIGVQIKDSELVQWRDLVASVQDSIDVVEGLPDYVPIPDLETFPRLAFYRPERAQNPGNAWAWKVTINGAEKGPLCGLKFALKDNIAVKDVPMLVGTEVFTDYIPNIDASKAAST